jgi:hypothetical protein
MRVNFKLHINQLANLKAISTIYYDHTSMSQFDVHSWFLKAIQYFRALGFFASHSGSDEEVEKVIKAYWRGDWDEYLAAVIF